MSVGRFTKWRSLIDGQEALAIPDSVETHLDIWYPVDEGSGSSIADAQENGPDWTLNSPSWVSNEFWRNFGLDYDGVDDEANSDSTVSIPNGDISLCTWVTMDELGDGNRPWVGFGDTQGNLDSDNEFGTLTLTDGDGTIRIWQGTDATSNPVELSGELDQDTRYFIGATFDFGTESAVYVWDENSFQNSGTGSPTSSPSAGSHYLQSVDFDDRVQLDCTIDAYGFQTDGILSQEDFEDIWEDTKPE